MGEVRIAIADDCPAFVAAAAAYVARLPGCLLVAREAAPDVLLLDLGPAPVRGLERLREVKAAAAAPVIVAMTLFHSPEAAAAAQRAGAHALLGKDAFVPGLNQVLATLFPAKAA